MVKRDTSRAATPIECVQKGGDPEKVVVYACGTCKIAHASAQESLECCAPLICETCGREFKGYCETCSNEKQRRKDQEVYDRATKIKYSEYSGDMVCCDHCDEYFPDVDSYLDAHADDLDMRTWVWGTYESPLQLNAEDILAEQLEQQEFYDNAMENISPSAIKEMQAFFDTWLKNTELTSYMVDHAVVVDLDEEVTAFYKERGELLD